MAQQSPGKQIFTFVMWLALIPFVIFSLLLVFVNLVVAAAT